MSQLSESLGAVMGGVQKAMLIIHKDSVENVNTAEVSEMTQYVLSIASGLGDSSAEGVGNLLSAAQVDATVMQVQYNPASISIQANAQDILFTSLQQGLEGAVPNQNIRPPTVMLSVELIFDAMNPQDAFMMDKFRLSTGSVVSDVAGAVQNKKGGYTVQPQTDGLVAALLRAETRTVTFRWADMAFTGQLNEVRATYTMFSVSGKPIRSRVLLNIAQQVESKSDIKYWDQALAKVFASGNDVELKKPAQQLGNLLNLDLF